MKFTDLVDITKEGQRGLAYQSEDGRWRVSASDMGDPPFTWCVWQRRRATWAQRLPWLALASVAEAQGVATFLSTLPMGLSPLLLRDRVEWTVRRAATAGLAYASVRIGEMVMRRARDRVVRDIASPLIVDPGAERYSYPYLVGRDRLSRAQGLASALGWTTEEWFDVLLAIDDSVVSAEAVAEVATGEGRRLADVARMLLAEHADRRKNAQAGTASATLIGR